MTIELSQLRALKLLAQELNFSRAAARAKIAQPSFSNQIRRLEDVLGVRLFERTTHTVKLTAAGENLLGLASSIIADADELVSRARAMSPTKARVLQVGYADIAMPSKMSVILNEFRRIYPDISIVMREEFSDALGRLVHDGGLDVAFLASQESAPLSLHQIGQERIFAAIPSVHRLAQKNRLSIADFKDQPMILFEMAGGRVPALQAAFVEICRREGFEPRVAKRSYSCSTHILTIVAGGEGIGLIAESHSRRAPPGVVFRDIEHPWAAVPIQLACRVGSADPYVAALIRIAGQMTGTEEAEVTLA